MVLDVKVWVIYAAAVAATAAATTTHNIRSQNIDGLFLTVRLRLMDDTD